MVVLYINHIGINAMANGKIYLEFIVAAHTFVDGILIDIDKDFGTFTQMITTMDPIPLGHMADDGVIDMVELLTLVQRASIVWVARHYEATVDATGRIILSE